VEVRADEAIGGRLLALYGLLGSRGVCSVNLISGLSSGVSRIPHRCDLEEAVDAFGLGDVEQNLGSNDVGLNERAGAEDRAIDVALGGEVDNLANGLLVEQVGNECGVADVAADEQKAIAIRERS